MEFRLERRLRLVTEPKHKSLYGWAITEIDEHGDVVGSDRIPWPWTLYFEATEIVLMNEVAVEESGGSVGDLPPGAKGAYRRAILAKLAPCAPRNESDRLPRPRYRMFGTDRVINDFQLDILPLKPDDKGESCQAWGSASYTSEVDFRFDTSDDCVAFNLTVEPSAFERYERMIAAGAVDEIILGVGGVSGFYSGWSPSISTNEVKVLTGGREQKVEAPEGPLFQVPRLGSVGSANLYIHAKRTGTKTLQQRSATSNEDDEPTVPLVQSAIDGVFLADVGKKQIELLASLNSSARWIAALLLALILVFLVR